MKCFHRWHNAKTSAARGEDKGEGKGAADRRRWRPPSKGKSDGGKQYVRDACSISSGLAARDLT